MLLMGRLSRSGRRPADAPAGTRFPGETKFTEHLPRPFLAPHDIYIIAIAGLESLSSGQRTGSALHKGFTFMSPGSLDGKALLRQAQKRKLEISLFQQMESNKRGGD